MRLQTCWLHGAGFRRMLHAEPRDALWQGLAYSAARDELLSCGLESTARVWDAGQLAAPPLRALAGHVGVVLQVTAFLGVHLYHAHHRTTVMCIPPV